MILIQKTVLNPLKSAFSRKKKAVQRFFREEDLFAVVIDTFKKEVTSVERLILLLIAVATLAIPVITFLVNQLGQHYQTETFFSLYSFIPAVIILLFCAYKWRMHRPYFGNIACIIALVFLSVMACAAGAMSIMSTPFFHAKTAFTLLHADQWIGIKQNLWMHWLAHRPMFKAYLQLGYMSTQILLPGTPILLAFFACIKSARKYLLSLLVGVLIAYIIYYFSPILAPAYVIHNHFFDPSAYALIDRTINIHQHLPYKLAPGAGLIAFPSCHVMFGLAGIYAMISAIRQKQSTRKKLILSILSLLIIPINILLIASTVLLGYHYGVDVIASFIILTGAWLMSQKLLQEKTPKVRAH